jgi:peptidyl-prolyl cis-trans isomerase B (cyclophilin B)
VAPASANNRETQDRLRRYQARRTTHETKVARRKRDNIVAIVALVAVVALATTAQIVYFTAGPGTPEPAASADPSASPAPDASADPGADASADPGALAPDAALSEFRTWQGAMTVNETIELQYELDGLAAPQAVASFVSLVQSGFYTGLTCHRLTTEGAFLLQCGDPAGDGTGGPDYRFGPIENAPLDNVYSTGVIAMARQGSDASSMGSQFFIIYADSPIPADEAGGYTVMGRVTSGLDALISGVTAAGVEGGGFDGAPAVSTTISGITIQ